ncbi:MAG: hypothetical protein LBU81_04190 [Methanosarcinales archaeon]|nr:hypothetical protein [Methanosarcinales archaeon]
MDPAVGFSGLGDGTAGNPFQITTISQLDEVRQDLSANYILMNDLDFNDSSMGNWVPLGFSENEANITSFNGVFNGNNKIIRHLVIDTEKGNLSGLFSAIGRGGSVSNLTISNAQVSGNAYVVVLSGSVVSSVITNCHVMNSSVSSISCSGILAGNHYDKSVIDFCTVENSSIFSVNEAGGIIGRNLDGIIQNSNAVSVTVNSVGCAGGISSLNQFDSLIENCSVTGFVSGLESDAGGITALSADSTIRNCRTSGTVQSGGLLQNTGGISGISSNTSLQNCSSLMSVSATNFGNAGGIAGYAEGCFIENCYALNDVINQTDSYSAKGNLSFGNCMALKFENKIGYIAGRSVNNTIVNCYCRDGIESNKMIFFGRLPQNKKF